MFNGVISDISVVLKETSLTITDSVETSSPVESEIVQVVYSLSSTEIPEKTRYKKKKDLQRPNTSILYQTIKINLSKLTACAEGNMSLSWFKKF